MNVLLRAACLVLITLTLVSCGFTLRGSGSTALSPETVFVRSAQDNGLLTQALQASLVNAQMQLVETASQANYIVSIGQEEFSTTIATVNGRARAAQYTLRLSVELALDMPSQNLLPAERIVVERSYFEDTANIAGSTREADILHTEMRQELVNQILNRLRVVTSTQSSGAD